MELANGIRPSELARSLGVAPSWVSDKLAELRLEIFFSQGVFPPLPPDQYEALRESIALHGVLVPIAIDEDGETIDGRHRKRACDELGIDCPFEIHIALTLTEKRELAVTLNAGRRQLTTGEKRVLATAELMNDAKRSDRAIARLTGMSPTSIGTIRKEIEIAEGVYAGVEAEARDSAVVSNLDSLPEKVFGVACCPNCKTELRALRRRGELVLEALIAAA